MASKAKNPDYAALRELFRPHIDSFDYFLDEGLEKALLSIRPAEIADPSTGSKLRNILSLCNPTLSFSLFCSYFSNLFLCLLDG
ncbi:hypothetical protein ACMD2_03433 [Ananas comosus]|uniref:Uncharacterized protein n=1 Tax=Ananas comosus TaxID=4615 RepID=A0A199V790_ANACO|nr:hypothetical protein ACMD2_03433 [Ananas comosus]